MKKLLLIAAIAAMSVGCTSRTEFGECVGFGKDGADPKLVYRVNSTNVVIGVVAFEMIAPPIIVALDETYCPVGKL